MSHSKGKKESARATRASVTAEMAKPRTARSARIMELNLETERIREGPSATMQGTVEKIILSRRSSRPGKAQIRVERADRGHRDLRIENTLTDEHGDDVSLKKGARVEVTVAAETGTSTDAANEDSQPTRHKKVLYSMVEDERRVPSAYEPRNYRNPSSSASKQKK